MPFKNADGYHSKTIAYSIWHIFRIEDIVAHELIEENNQILFTDDYIKRINAPIITPGNELKGVEISEVWLVNYWCSKNIKGLIQMPFSRHWIMHIEAINRIKSKLLTKGANFFTRFKSRGAKNCIKTFLL